MITIVSSFRLIPIDFRGFSRLVFRIFHAFKCDLSTSMLKLKLEVQVEVEV